MRKPAATSHRGVTRQAVAEAAADLVASDGLEALSIRQVANRLGVWPTTVTHHPGGRRGGLGGERGTGGVELREGPKPPRRVADHGHASRRWPARRPPRAADRAPGRRHLHRAPWRLAGATDRARTRDPSRRADASRP